VPQRRLAAILAVDVAGYSRLMGADEEGTLAALNAHRAKRIDPAIAGHDGRIVKTTGDGLLAEFTSVVEAVRCAVEVQEKMATANQPIAEGKRIQLRIGINLGDVIIEGDDIFGDGVNVAARLQALAPVGGICISQNVHEQVRDKLELKFDDLGEQAVKNIARPVRAFSVRIGPASAAPMPAPPLPDRPSIAVLPFANLSGDPEQDYFADGMVEEIITGLSRVKSLFVIARNSSFFYKGRAVDVRQIGRELGVRYVLEGSVRKGGNRVRITAQLIEASAGSHLWAEKYEGGLDDLFDLQDRITLDVVRAIEPSVLHAEIARARQKYPESLDAYDHFLRALADAWKFTPADAARALEQLEAALKINPDYMLAHAFASWCHEVRFTRETHDPADRAAALHHARVVLASGADDATALAFAGFEVALLERDYDAAFTALNRALAFNPNSALALSFCAIVNAFSGKYVAAIEFAAKADRQSPLDPLRWVGEFARMAAYCHSGRYAEAVEVASRVIQVVPQFGGGYIFLVTALVRLGRIEDARAATRRLLEVEPRYRLELLRTVTLGPPERVEVMIEALREAGLPE
jgi:TolB-like protein/Flp pilus assembly protein TadD